MRRRHILLANVFFAPFSYGGATIVAQQVARALIRQGHYRITAVSLCSRGDLAPYAVIKCQKDGIENYLINVPHHRSYAEGYNNPEITGRLAELINVLQPDLVHAHCVQDIGTGVITAAETAGIPVILSVHDFWWLCERQFMIRMDERYCGQNPVRIEKCRGCVDNFWNAKTRFDHLQSVAGKAAMVTYPSHFAKQLSEASGFAIGRGTVWENGVQLPQPDFFKAQAARRMKDRRLTFGYIGGPAQIKGWPLIRQAFEGLKTSNFRGIVVDGSLDGSWWKPSDLTSLKGVWDIHPRFEQDAMDDFYSQIDVLLFMSQWKETFGLAIREALARGIAVIQTDSGGTVEHGTLSPDNLIPIGAPADLLQRQIETMLSEGVRKTDPHPVTTFDDQALAFVKLVDLVLDDLEHAA